MKTLLITGGSSGIGKATVDLFSSRGWKVIELSRSGESHDEVIHIDCDITNEAMVKSAVAEAMKRIDHIDVLVSNAGFGISGAIEFTPTDEAKRQMDVNFFGALNIVKAVLPQMRKQQYGHIIFTSSVAAILSIPYQSFYSASKAALNALALALQNEVRSFGIHVSVLMPGDVSTGFTNARDKNEVGRDIYQNIHTAVAAMEKDEIGGMPPIKMAKDIWKIVGKKNPAPQYVGGYTYKVFCFLDRILPKRLVNWIVGKLY